MSNSEEVREAAQRVKRIINKETEVRGKKVDYISNIESLALANSSVGSTEIHEACEELFMALLAEDFQELQESYLDEFKAGDIYILADTLDVQERAMDAVMNQMDEDFSVEESPYVSGSDGDAS